MITRDALFSHRLRLAAVGVQVDAFSRRYWLTFRGALYFPPEAGALRMALLQLATTSQRDRDRPIIVALSCKSYGKAITSKGHMKPICERADQAFAESPPYIDLLNTTFALVAEGRQPMTYRLDEAMAAGVVPVFASAEPFVRPFSQLIEWDSISLTVSPDRIAQLPEMLSSMPRSAVRTMQAGVRRVYREYLEPNAARSSFYKLLRQRAKRRARGSHHAMGRVSD